LTALDGAIIRRDTTLLVVLPTLLLKLTLPAAAVEAIEHH
jgi:hypothetical protein